MTAVRAVPWTGFVRAVPWAGLAGIGAVTAGVWLRFGLPYGLIAAGALLILDAIS